MRLRVLAVKQSREVRYQLWRYIQWHEGISFYVPFNEKEPEERMLAITSLKWQYMREIHHSASFNWVFKWKYFLHIMWERVCKRAYFAWQHNPVFLPGKSSGQKSLTCGHKRFGHDSMTKQVGPRTNYPVLKGNWTYLFFTSLLFLTVTFDLL